MKKHLNNKKMWFREYGWIYLPNSRPGYLLTILIIVFNILVFLAIDRGSHSASDTFPDFYHLVPQGL